jgi:hypothetical protein
MLVVAATSTNSSSARGKKTANTESKNQIGGEGGEPDPIEEGRGMEKTRKKISAHIRSEKGSRLKRQEERRLHKKINTQ